MTSSLTGLEVTNGSISCKAGDSWSARFEFAIVAARLGALGASSSEGHEEEAGLLILFKLKRLYENGMLGDFGSYSSFESLKADQRGRGCFLQSFRTLKVNISRQALLVDDEIRRQNC